MSIPQPLHFEALTDAELEQFGAKPKMIYERWDAGPLLDDIDALKENYRRLRQHHIVETEWLWSELERARPGVTTKLRKPRS